VPFVANQTSPEGGRQGSLILELTESSKNNIIRQKILVEYRHYLIYHYCRTKVQQTIHTKTATITVVFPQKFIKNHTVQPLAGP